MRTSQRGVAVPSWIFFKQNGAWTEIWLDKSQRVLIGAKGENAFRAPEPVTVLYK